MFDWGPILTYFMKSGSIIYFWRYNNANGKALKALKVFAIFVAFFI